MVDAAELERLLSKAAEPALAQIREDASGAPPDIRRMLQFLESALFEPSLNAYRWRKALGLRDNVIAIDFHCQIGITPRQYIEMHRLETAARLLRGTELGVWRIGELVGYSTLGVFSKAFNRVMGRRPTAYRKVMAKPREAVSIFFETRDLRAALAGTLDEKRAVELVEAILRLYPNLSATISPTGAP